MDDLLSEFLTETNESISTLDSELVNLEQNPDNPGLIDNIFRLVHTIKGTCGFLGLPRLESVAHAAENVLGKFRDRELVVTPEAVTLILASFDRIKDILGVLEATEAEPAGDDKALIEQLNVMASGGTVTADAAASAAESGGIVADAAPAAEEAAGAEDASADDGPTIPGEVSLDELEAAFAAAKGPEELAAEAAAAEVDAQPAEEAPAEPAPETAPVAEPAAVAEPTAAKNDSHKSSNQTIRVNVELLENLMTMVSELVLSRNQLLQMIRGREDSEFTVPLQRLSHVTTELQEGVMKTRMQPIGNAWAKLPRIVRDLSHELHKKIDLQMNGAETELDRQVLELIKDPLTHMVRNSADHGLETTEERLAAGKPETGKVILNAYHEGGHINIEITDDGRGIPVDKIKAKALEKGLASGADLEEMSDQRILQFIFNAGFSTAEKVTSVSGRGVGMDVVRSNIEKIGGTVDVKSVEGKGSVFTIKIPLTLAIVSALIVSCAEERFAIPQLSVVELVRASKDGEHKIERINGTPVLRLRDRLLPLVYLDKVLGLRDGVTMVAAGDDDEAADTETMEEAFIVVSQIGSQTFGLVVDQVFDTEEIVVKPVAPILRDTKLFSGNTILGDGTVIMILDPNGISNMHVSTTIGEDRGEADARQRAYADDLVALLLFHVGNQEPKAVPLSLVARLEEVDVKDIEHSDGQMMVQYRGRLMPLVKFDSSYEVRSEGRQPMLVFADGERSMGLIVDDIVDIVEEALDIELVSRQERLIGSAVVDGKATEIIDVAYYLTSALGDWFSEKGASSGSGVVEKNRILLVDDSPFFRNMLVPLLNVAGYQVTTAGTADEALELRDSGQHFDVIISDIEMPGMNGFEFAEAVKTDTRWDDTPLVALSSHTTPQDFDRGRQAGFVDYVSKTNRDALLDVLSQTLAVAGGAA